VGSTHRTPPQAIAEGSSAPYARSVGGVRAAWPSPGNGSGTRSRGWGLGNNALGWGVGSAPDAEGAYTAPGWPTDARNKTRWASSRGARLGFSLADTPLSLAAKKAARAGVSLEALALYTDDASPTRVLLSLSKGAVGRAEAAAMVADRGGPGAPGADIVLEGAAGVPDAPEERARALALATGEQGQAFAAAAAAALTPEEAAALAGGGDADGAREAAAVFQRYVDEYKGVAGRGVAAAVAAAAAKRDAALARAATLDAAEAKLAAVAADFDARAYGMARAAAAREEAGDVAAGLAPPRLQ